MTTPTALSILTALRLGQVGERRIMERKNG